MLLAALGLLASSALSRSHAADSANARVTWSRPSRTAWPSAPARVSAWARARASVTRIGSYEAAPRPLHCSPPGAGKVRASGAPALHTLAKPSPPHTDGAAQPPHSRVPPQPSESVPQALALSQVSGRH